MGQIVCSSYSSSWLNYMYQYSNQKYLSMFISEMKAQNYLYNTTTDYIDIYAWHMVNGTTCSVMLLL